MKIKGEKNNGCSYHVDEGAINNLTNTLDAANKVRIQNDRRPPAFGYLGIIPLTFHMKNGGFKFQYPSIDFPFLGEFTMEK